MERLREDRYNGKGKREEEVVKNQRRRQPGVREGRRAVNQRDGDLRLGREWKSAGMVVLSISSAVIKTGHSRDVMLTTSGLYLQ